MVESERRYSLAELLRIAEERTVMARMLKESGSADAANRYYEWSNVVFAVRFLKEQELQESAREESAPVNSRVQSAHPE